MSSSWIYQLVNSEKGETITGTSFIQTNLYFSFFLFITTGLEIHSWNWASLIAQPLIILGFFLYRPCLIWRCPSQLLLNWLQIFINMKPMAHNVSINAKHIVRLPCKPSILTLTKLTIFAFSSSFRELPTKKNLSSAFSDSTSGICVKSLNTFS